MTQDLATKITNLIKNSSGTNLSEIDKEKIVGVLTEYLQNEDWDQRLGHKPVLTADFTGDSLYEDINGKIDLDGARELSNPTDTQALDYLTEVINAISGSGSNFKMWNESVQKMVENLISDFTSSNPTIKVTGAAEGANFKVNDVKQANAGRSFSTTDGKPWVIKEKNIDGKTYDEVRDADKIESVLTSSKNMDFTHSQTNNAVSKYIRLIMPRYTRRVEVEDLNRNFWVIGQTVTAISAFLFDSNSPITKMFKYLISENIQTWENLLHLWAAVDLLNTNKYVPYVYSSTIRQVVDLPRAIDKPLRDINAFVSEYDDINEVESRLASFPKMYPNMHLCLLLRCRLGNYEKDYYHTEVYPYVALYDANKKQWTYTKLGNYSSDKHRSFPFGLTLRADSGTPKAGAPSGVTPDVNPSQYPNIDYAVQNIRGHVYAIREDVGDPNNYHFYYPLSSLPPRFGYVDPQGTTKTTPNSDNETDTTLAYPQYHAIVQIEPVISTDYRTGVEEEEVRAKIHFNLYDIARKLHFYPSNDPNHSPQDYDWQNDKYLDIDSHKYYKLRFPANGDIQINSSNSVPKTGNLDNTLTRLGSSTAFDSWDKAYKNSEETTNIPTGTSLNKRDSGFQGSLCDMITYRGVTKKANAPVPPEALSHFKILNIGNFIPSGTGADLLTSKFDSGFVSVAPNTSSQMDINTYGIGCYYVPNTTDSYYRTNNWINDTDYYNTVPTRFIKNLDLYNNTNNIRNKNANISSYLHSYTEVNQQFLYECGRRYIEELVKVKKGQQTTKDSNVTDVFTLNSIYITRIGVGYWSGVTATVWNSGIFCDIFLVLNDGTIIDGGPLYLFDGYWTNSGYTFTTVNSSRWRQLMLKGNEGTYNPNTQTFDAKGTLQWNDHNKSDSYNTLNLRPHCNFELATKRYGFTNYTWSDDSQTGLKYYDKVISTNPVVTRKTLSELDNSQMVMLINKDNIFNNVGFANGAIYHFKNSPVQAPSTLDADGYNLYGSRDYGVFYLS